MTTFTRLFVAALITSVASSVSAATFSAPACTAASDIAAHDAISPGVNRVWQVSFGAVPAASVNESVNTLSTSIADDDQEAQPATRPRAKAFEYSDAYQTRLKIHKIASLSTIPLFVTETILGQKLYNFSGGDGVRTAHQVVAATLAGVFTLNTVTGVMNLWEGRKDPNRKKRVIVHSVMMLGADAGFTVAGLMAPSRHNFENYQDRFAPHRAIALTSMAVATTAYLIMIFGK